MVGKNKWSDDDHVTGENLKVCICVWLLCV